MYGIPFLSVMVSLLDAPWLSIFQILISLFYWNLVSFPMNLCVGKLLSESIMSFWGLDPAPFSPPSSCQNPSDLQHWDEEQDEGAHHDRRCYLLEVDLPEHSCTRDWQCRLPLEHGGRLTARESLWPPFQPGRLPDHQLPHWRQAEMAPAHWHLSPGNFAFHIFRV